jgi:transposase
MADIEKKTKRYPSDLTDEEWERIAPLLPKPCRRGRKPAVDLREIMNAIRYMARSDAGWRMLPKDFPPWQTVYWWFRRFVRMLLFRTIHDVALMIDRERSGRSQKPTVAVIDSQSVKAPASKRRGYDAAKKIVGRKRHIAVDTDGRLLMINLTTADIADTPPARRSSCTRSARVGPGSNTCSPTAPTRAANSWTKQPSKTSSSRSSDGSSTNPASRSCLGAGLSNAPSPG